MISSQNKIRPRVITWLCTGSALVGVLYIFMYLSLIGTALSGNIPARLFPGVVLEYFQVGYWFLLVEITLTLLGIIGVRMMWRMKKNGFYLYAASKAAIYFFPVVCMSLSHLFFPALVITSIGIVMYGTVFIRHSEIL